MSEHLGLQPILTLGSCEKWKTTVKKNPASFEERRKFEVSEPVESVSREMSEHLDLQPILTLEELDLLYVTCNFDLAWRSGPGAGPWCDLFTKGPAPGPDL